MHLYKEHSNSYQDFVRHSRNLRMSWHIDAHDSKDARRNSTSASNEYEQVFERYTYKDYEVQFQFLLNVMKGISKRTTFNVPTINPEAAKIENQAELAPVGDPPTPEGWMQVFGSTINKISSELTSKTKTDDEGEKASRILKALSNYSLEAKVVMVLAAFTVKYGKVCLAAGLYPLNPVARAVVSLRRQQSVLDRPQYLTEWHSQLAGIIKKMQDLADGILHGEKTGSGAVELIIQCAIVCSSQMMTILIPDDHNRVAEKLSKSYKWNLCALDKRLSDMLGGQGPNQTPQDADKDGDSTKPNPENATAAKKEKPQPKSKGRSSSRVKPANICC